ncbi:DUF2147 domain-containing protein [Phenylobacterium sp.]|uniref:DUF2147 domain-containing protein n=1 Tax=Phenylobacterium sp. TaxID=1871053 RepID=UPI002F3FF529
MARRLAFGSLALAAALFSDGSLQAETTAGATVEGIWRNPKNSVHVEIRPCGQAECGVVIWASPKAVADARRGGTKELVGVELFSGFVRNQDGSWKGKVFVPDLNGTFTGTAVLMDERTLRAHGCLLARIFCKSQLWRRVEEEG